MVFNMFILNAIPDSGDHSSLSLMPNWYARLVYYQLVKAMYDTLRLDDRLFCLVIRGEGSLLLTRFYDSFHVLICSQLSMFIRLDISIRQLKDILVSCFMSLDAVQTSSKWV